MMTREHKIALILGFALVLVVGVLVSDHLSGAREAKLVKIELPEQTDVPITRPHAPELQRFALAKPTDDDRLSHIGESAASRSVQENPPATPLAAAPVDERTMLESIRKSVNEAMRDLRNGNGPQPAIQTEPRNTITMGEPQGRARGRDTNSGEVRIHIVRKGETLWSIAERYYGTGFVHEDLRRYNQSRIRSATALNPGLTLLIPSRRDLGMPPRSDLSQNTTNASPAGRDRASTSTYVVKKGDTLSEISLDRLGTSKRWEEILELNSDKLDEATDIAVGMKLRLPRR